MVQEIFASAKGASLQGGLGACSPRKFSNLKALKRYFSALRPIAVSKRFRKLIVIFKIDRYFLLNFDKKSVARCHQLQHIFIIKNYCHTPLNARKIRY